MKIFFRFLRFKQKHKAKIVQPTRFGIVPWHQFYSNFMIATAELDLSQHPDIETILISTVYFPHLRAFFARCGVCLCTRSLKLSPRQIPFHCVCSQEIPDNFSIFNCSLTPPDQSNPCTIFLLSFHVHRPAI